MKKLLLILTMLLVPSLMLGTGESDPTFYSGVEEMWFQNGVLPSPSYSGIVAAGIGNDSTTATFGDLKGVLGGEMLADSTFFFGDATAGNIARRIVISVDLSALPDSAVIVEARLYMLAISTDQTATDFLLCTMYRLLNPFDATADWTNRVGSTAWAKAGVIDDTPPTYNALGSSAFRPRGLNSGGGAGYTGIWVYPFNANGLAVVSGMDTLYSATAQTANPADALMVPDTMVGLGFTNSYPAWYAFDITLFAQRWHTGQWENDGILLTLDPQNAVVGESAFYYEWHSTADIGTSLSPYLSPFVKVKYLYAQATAGASGGGGAVWRHR